jgi:hypothetical protein
VEVLTICHPNVQTGSFMETSITVMPLGLKRYTMRLSHCQPKVLSMMFQISRIRHFTWLAENLMLMDPQPNNNFNMIYLISSKLTLKLKSMMPVTLLLGRILNYFTNICYRTLRTLDIRAHQMLPLDHTLIFPIIPMVNISCLIKELTLLRKITCTQT